MKHLDKDKYEITLVGIAKDGKWYILKQEDNDLSKDTWLDGAEVVEGVFDLLRSQDVAFPVLHGLYGEDGTIQGLFELAQLPYVGCRVLETAVLGNDDIIVSRVGQIMPHGEFYTFESKYEDAESKTCIPAKVDEEIQEQIRKYAVRAFKAIDGHGLSRVDFFLDKKTNHVYLNEINTLPGFTSISMYPQLMEDLGYSYSELLDKLIEIADEN